MKNEPTNGELAIMIMGVSDTLTKLEKHVEDQNGKVDKNSSFRNKVLGALAVISFFGVINLLGLALLWTRLI